MISYVQAEAGKELEDARTLFMEYAAMLGCSPCLRNIEKELDSLPGEYHLPRGRLMLSVVDNIPFGCVALRGLDDLICEMRRLYVRPEARGRKIGRGLAESVIEEARKAGYARMRLYTLPAMKEAISLYRSLGFRDIAPYGDHIITDALYMELDLPAHESSGSNVILGRNQVIS